MENNLELVSKLLDIAKNRGVTEADAIIIDSSSLNTEIRLGKLISSERSQSTAAALRVIINKQQAIVSSSNMSLDSLNELTDRAISMAKVTPPNSDLFLADKSKAVDKILDLELFDEKEPSPEHLIELAVKSEDKAFENKLITNSEGASSFFSTNTVCFATSNGILHSYKTSTAGLSLQVIAGESEQMQTGDSFSYARFLADIKSPDTIGSEAAQMAVNKMHPKKLKTSKLPVIFDRRVARSILGAFAGAVNGMSISRGTSFLCNMLNTEVFNKDITIIDDPFILKGLASRPCDAEAIMGSKLKFVDKGTLSNYFLDLQTAHKLRMNTTGHAVRGLSSAPTPSPSNLYIQPGTSSLDEMIKSLKKGILITEVFGHGANIITGDYSQGAVGYYIENGEILFPINEITIASNLKEMFKKIIPASDLKFETSLNSPSLFIEEMTIGGK